MRKIKRIFALFCIGGALLCGCTKSNIVSPEDGQIEGPAVPQLEVSDSITIDWDMVKEALNDEFMDPYGTFADEVMGFELSYNQENGQLNVMVPVGRKTTGASAVAFGEAILKVIGEETATQDFSYAPPSDEELYYGGFFDSHDVAIRLYPYDSQNDTSTYFINDTMKAGEQRELMALRQ